MKATTRIWTFSVRNWDIILTMAIAAGIAVLSYSQVVEPQIVSVAILSVLFLIACSLLVNRETNNRLQSTTEKIWNRMEKPSIDEVIIPYKKWMDDIEGQLCSAREVWILSRTCVRFWEDYHTQLQTVLANKGSIRLLLVDPRVKNGALRMIANSMELVRARDLSGQFTQITLENDSSSNRLGLLRARVKEFVLDITTLSTQVGKDHLSLRAIDHLPASTLVIINGNSEKGIIFVELGTYNSNGRDRPTFSLFKTKDRQLFALYLDEYQDMWERASPMDGDH